MLDRVFFAFTGATVCLALSCIFGILTHNTTLVTWLTDGSPINPVTAANFLLLGFSTILSQRDRQVKRNGKLSSVIAAVTIILFSINIGLHWAHSKLTVSDLLGVDSYRYGTISIPTSVGLIFCALGILASNGKLRLREGTEGGFGIVACVIGLLRLFLSPREGETEVLRSDMHGMAFPTGVMMVLLGGSLIFMSPRAGLIHALRRRDLPGKLGRRTLYAMLLGSIFSFAAYLAGPYWFGAFGAGSALSTAVICISATIIIGIWVQVEYHSQAVEKAEFVFDSPKHLVATLAYDGHLLHLNSSWELATQWTTAELRGKKLLEFIHPSDLELVQELLASEVETASKNEDACRFVKKDGSYAWLELYTMRSETRGVTYIGARDISDRKATEANAELERNVVTSILDWAEDVIVVINEQGVIARASKSSEKAFGYPASELVGLNVSVLMGSPHRQLHDGYLDRYKKTGERRIIGKNRELEGRRKDGTAFPLVLSVGEMHTPDGSLYFGVMRDITSANQILEDLQMAKDDAIKANQAKSEFLSRMSHELRTPLNAVLGFAQLIELNYENPTLTKMVSSIQRGGRHLLQLINEILDISRIESGKLALSIEPVSVDVTFVHAIDLIRPLADFEGITLEYDRSEFENLFVFADKQRLLQIFINLLSNAVKYNRTNGTVRIRCWRPEVGQVHIDIEDDGPGIPVEFQSGLFEPFDRLGVETVEGSGLGLSLSKKLAELMEGEVKLSASSPSGSVFTVVLRETDFQIIGEAAPGKAPELRGPNGELKTATVLYIEDNLSNVELMEFLLAKWRGIELISAMQGSLGLELAKKHVPDIILLDVHLPDFGGFYVLTSLQADTRTRDIPVIVVSADATDVQRQQMLEVGARAYLTKPLDVELFRNTVSTILDEIGIGVPKDLPKEEL